MSTESLDLCPSTNNKRIYYHRFPSNPEDENAKNSQNVDTSSKKSEANGNL